jgi:hypothetical protein
VQPNTYQAPVGQVGTGPLSVPTRDAVAAIDGRSCGSPFSDFVSVSR